MYIYIKRINFGYDKSLHIEYSRIILNCTPRGGGGISILFGPGSVSESTTEIFDMEK